jgi:hypothetical protein
MRLRQPARVGPQMMLPVPPTRLSAVEGERTVLKPDGPPRLFRRRVVGG